VKEYTMTHAAALTLLPEQALIILSDIEMIHPDLWPASDAVGQTKAGYCLLP
jgi:hypothetical protein